MKLMTAITVAGAVMAAGCTQMMERKGYVKNIYGEWMKPGTSYFGDGNPSKLKPAPAFARSPSSGGGDIGPMPNLIPLPDWGSSGGSSSPQVVVTGNAPVTTISPTPFGGTRVVNYGFPAYRRPVDPYPYYGY
jgi:hypothetical protein